MRYYECIFIVRQDLPTQDVHKLADKYKEMMSKMQAVIIKKEYWGLRALSYDIKKNKKGHYLFFGLHTVPDTIKNIEDNFKVSEDVIKFLMIKVRKIDNKSTLMMQMPNETNQ